MGPAPRQPSLAVRIRAVLFDGVDECHGLDHVVGLHVVPDDQHF